MTNNYHRIRTDITKDQVVRAKLTQDIDFLEILSLKISQEDAYKLHVSNYGVIVGRVLANDAFGIPNAKVSVFIPLDDEDKTRSEISSIYPYTTSQSKDSENRRYNLLPDDSNDVCYRVVGSFPNKRLVLDNNTEIEVFEKYWKYTTVTNKSGDYMIFGVPTGNHEVHVDVDLSDIGVLSQKPRDFMYKGYSITQFDNSSQFKESTNLDNLSQLLSQNSAVHVYPFWGDTDVEEVAISRCDLQVQYKFEPTCVFFGSIVSDNFSNNIGDKCNPSKFVGFNRKLVAGEGTIEMIRKTQDGLIEEFQIQGNRLIDGNGVWCYQIPMNLDYVGTDEFGNIVPTDDPKKGIPTRTSVRFRVSMQETSSEGISRHRAKYLIPNVHEIANVTGVKISNPNQYDQCYEFGSATPDEFFRDLYWNKVYSVKNYIPRIQLGSAKNTQKYSAIRTVNESGNLNPFPFNHGRFRLVFSYRLLCLIFTIVLSIICGLNWFVSFLAGLCIPLGFTKLCPFKWVCGGTFCISVTGGLSEDSDENIEYFPCCKTKSCMKCSEPGCKRETDFGEIMNKVQQSLAQEYDTVNLDFYNDWINGCLYFPLWFWKKTKKKKFLFGLFSKKAVNRYCNCDSNYKKLRVTEGCSLHFNGKYEVTDKDKGKKFHEMFPDTPINVGHGIIKEVENKNGLKIYYYSPGIPRTNDYKDTADDTVDYARLYSTDIILLGSLNDCDLDNLPRPFLNIPSTTANIPYISTLKDSATDSDNDDEKGVVEVTGMDWLDNVNKGLFMDLTCTEVRTKPKTCINIARMSELGVTLDTRYYDAISDGNVLKYDNERPADGLITRYELVDNETRAMFASLNHNGLVEKVRNLNTGYDTYKLIYNYPTDFDGHLSKFAPSYTKKFKVKTYDNQNQPYVDYIFGLKNKDSKMHFYLNNGDKRQMPLFNNSFYFYFGLNEGNTAIDKFNNLFYSECFKNVKYPFTMTYSTTPAKWCKEVSNILVSDINSHISKLENDYATIDVTLKNIKLPYSYTLYDEFNEVIMSEDNIYSPILKFGYKVENGGYTNKFGALMKLSDGSYVTHEDGVSAYLLDNGSYKLKVVDVNGNSVTQQIVIMQSSIVANISVIGLGDKYYEGTSNENDFCNEFENYGEIIINSISIDGKNYLIKNCEKDGDGYKLTCEYKAENNTTFTSYVFLEIEPLDETSENGSDITLSGCTCNKTNSNIDQYVVKTDGTLHFNIWIPIDYKITVTQYCRDMLNDNTSSDTVNMPNGKPFLTYVGETPLRFVIGKNTSIKDGNFNRNFYDKTAVDYIQDGWFNLHDESVYKFEDADKVSGIEVWKDFVDADYVTNDSGVPTDVTLSTKMDILSYKFARLMEMSNMFYIFDDDRTISFIANGGKAPILYRGSYPKYSDFSFETDDGNNKVSNYIYDSDAFITCPSNAGNVVGFNYSMFDNEKNMTVRVNTTASPRFNTLFSDDEHLGNYFAAYTQNAGCKFIDGQWRKENGLVYLSDPYKSNPYVLDVLPGESTVLDSFKPFVTGITNSNNSYFRGLTVDRRIDYSYFIIMPYNENNGISLGSDDWKNGRFTGYQINGLALAYDNEKNYVGVGTRGNVYEYYIEELPTDDTESNNYKWFGNVNRSKIKLMRDFIGGNKQKLYSHTFRCGKTYDINDRFWAKNEMSANTSSVDGILFAGNTGGTTAAFDKKNYPTKRKIDMINFPASNRYTYSAINCKYSNQLEYINNGGNTFSYSSIVQEGEEVSFDINGNNSVQFDNGDLATSASNSIGNVTFKRTSGTTFKSSDINVTFKIPDDTANSTHNNFVYLPYYNTFNVGSNPYKAIKTSSTLTDEFGSFIGNILTTLNGSQITNNKNIISTSSDFWSQVSKTNDKIKNDVFDIGLNRFIIKSSKAPLYCDNSLMKSISFSLKQSVNMDFMSIFYLRRYINNAMDNLSKDILTLNIGCLVDTRKIIMDVECGIDNSMTGEGSATIPTGGTGSTTGSATGDVSTTVKRQVTTFKITIPDSTDNSSNQGFTDPSRISAAIKCDGKVAADSTVTLNGNILNVKIVWGSALSGVLLNPLFSKKCELFIKMPNNLIYKFNFSLISSGFA